MNSGPPKNTGPCSLAPDVVCSQQGTKDGDGDGVWALLIHRSEEGESGRGLTENRVVSRVWGNQAGGGGPV